MLPTRDSGCKGTKKNEDSSYCYDVFYICLTFFYALPLVPVFFPLIKQVMKRLYYASFLQPMRNKKCEMLARVKLNG